MCRNNDKRRPLLMIIIQETASVSGVVSLFRDVHIAGIAVDGVVIGDLGIMRASKTHLVLRLLPLDFPSPEDDVILLV